VILLLNKRATKDASAMNDYCRNTNLVANRASNVA
jgi:hypothetical protein